MDLDANYQHPPRYVASLSKLPRPLFHQVLDELPLIKVMTILSYKNEYLKDCILSHLTYGELFRLDEDLQNAISLFKLCRSISEYTRGGDFSYWYFWNQIYSYSIRNPKALRNGMVKSIQDLLALNEDDQELLIPYGTTPYPKTPQDDYATLLAKWSWIRDAKANLNIAKSNQWKTAGDLIADYPGKLMLKKPLDPSQDGPRKNVKHIENYFQSTSKKILKDRRFKRKQQFYTKCSASFELIQVVPYNKYLWLFLETLSKYPFRDVVNHPQGAHSLKTLSKSTLDEQVEALRNPMNNLTLTNSMFPVSKLITNSNTEFSYPTKIAVDIKTVLEGLENIYTGSSLLTIPRIDWEAEKPIFDNNNQPHSDASWLPVGVHRCPVAKYKPHDEREYEWLKAFLRVVTWMEEIWGSP